MVEALGELPLFDFLRELGVAQFFRKLDPTVALGNFLLELLQRRGPRSLGKGVRYGVGLRYVKVDGPVVLMDLLYASTIRCAAAV